LINIFNLYGIIEDIIKFIKDKNMQQLLTLRIEKDTKDKFADLCDQLDVSMSQAVYMFIVRSITHNKLPFDFSPTENKESYETLMSIKNELFEQFDDKIFQLNEAIKLLNNLRNNLELHLLKKKTKE
jgi:addiction module RelB/DinJ family antitoxin